MLTRGLLSRRASSASEKRLCARRSASSAWARLREERKLPCRGSEVVGLPGMGPVGESFGDTGQTDITRGPVTAPFSLAVLLAGSRAAVARSRTPMKSPTRRRPLSDADLHARLSARIEALEDRVRRLEVLVRGAAVAARSRASGSTSGRTVARVRREPPAPRVKGRARPRCPGCTLELPAGPRGGSCVWCGFQFDAVRLRKRKG